MAAMTLRLSDADADALEAIARAEGRSVASLLREAVAVVIDTHRRDPSFKARARASLERQRQLLERLAE